MSIATEGELSPTDFSPNKETGRPGYDYQRDKLLPIHAGNIPRFIVSCNLMFCRRVMPDCGLFV